MRPLLFFSLTLALSATLVDAQDKKAVEDMQALDARIAATPDDPLLHYRRAQLLAKAKQPDEAYAAAQTAMEKFVLAKKELPWLMLESFTVDGCPVTVHFNMGADERSPPQDGIARPLSFRVYNREGSKIVETFDFERGYSGGKLLTAAFGKTTEEGHANYGVLIDPAAKYSVIRKHATALIEQIVKEK